MQSIALPAASKPQPKPGSFPVFKLPTTADPGKITPKRVNSEGTPCMASKIWPCLPCRMACLFAPLVRENLITALPQPRPRPLSRPWDLWEPNPRDPGLPGADLHGAISDRPGLWLRWAGNLSAKVARQLMETYMETYMETWHDGRKLRTLRTDGRFKGLAR